jgi:hypothetical protein
MEGLDWQGEVNWSNVLHLRHKDHLAIPVVHKPNINRSIVVDTENLSPVELLVLAVPHHTHLPHTGGVHLSLSTAVLSIEVLLHLIKIRQLGVLHMSPDRGRAINYSWYDHKIFLHRNSVQLHVFCHVHEFVAVFLERHRWLLRVGEEGKEWFVDHGGETRSSKHTVRWRTRHHGSNLVGRGETRGWRGHYHTLWLLLQILHH